MRNGYIEKKALSLHDKIIGYKTFESWSSVPHVTFLHEADATELLDVFYAMRKEKPDVYITINTLLLKICVEAIKSAPKVNSHISYSANFVTGCIEVKKDINITIPWLLDNGDIVAINLRNFGNKSITEMQEYVNKTAAKIKNCNIYVPMYNISIEMLVVELKKGHFFKFLLPFLGTKFGRSKTRKPIKSEIIKYNQIPDDEKIMVRDLEPGTVTLTNIGSILKEQHGNLGVLVLVPPQIFIIGVGSIQDRACVIGDGNGGQIIAIRKIIPMCLAFDHRALNFNEIIPFIQKLEYIFNNPDLLKEYW